MANLYTIGRIFIAENGQILKKLSSHLVTLLADFLPLSLSHTHTLAKTARAINAKRRTEHRLMATHIDRVKHDGRHGDGDVEAGRKKLK